jgi:hypothetical protein
MAFSNGLISMSRFAVAGDGPATPDQELLDKLEAHAMKVEDGIVEELAWGWNGGRHVLDNRFDFERNIFNDSASFALRVDTNRVPAELRQAYKIMEEETVAAANPSGFISKKQKKDVKETLARRIDDEMRSGKFRRSRITSMLWDLLSRAVYSPASAATQEKMQELFERSFGLELQHLCAGRLALRHLEAKGRRRDYEDLRPTRFAPGPDGESQHPEYPWTAKGSEPKDYLGNEFLLWLWHEAEHHDGVIRIEGGDATIFIDKSLDLDCAYGMTGKDSLRGVGPSRMPEARDGLRTGKVPRKAGIVLDANGQQFNFVFNAERFSVSACKLPEVQEADSPRTLFEERITLIRDLWKAVDGMYSAFLKLRVSSAWESHAGGIRKWILQNAKPVSAVA